MNKKVKYNFNLIANDYNNHHLAHNQFIKIIRNNFIISNDMHILDLGCGTGNETINLKKSFNCLVSGVEPSNRMLSIAKQNNKSINWLTGSAEYIPVTDKSVDILTAFFSIHHFDILEKSISEIDRVLSKNGKIFIFTISHEQMKNSLEYKFIPELLEADISRVPKIKDIQDILTQQGFSSITKVSKYETRKIDNNYLEMVKNRYRSGLRLLNQKQIDNAVLKIENEINKGNELIDEINCTVIITERNKAL